MPRPSPPARAPDLLRAGRPSAGGPHPRADERWFEPDCAGSAWRQACRFRVPERVAANRISNNLAIRRASSPIPRQRLIRASPRLRAPSLASRMASSGSRSASSMRMIFFMILNARSICPRCWRSRPDDEAAAESGMLSMNHEESDCRSAKACNAWRSLSLLGGRADALALAGACRSLGFEAPFFPFFRFIGESLAAGSLPFWIRSITAGIQAWPIRSRSSSTRFS